VKFTLKTDDILALYDLEQRINIEYPGVRKEHRPHVIRFINQKGGPHFILYSRLAGADVESVITEEQAYFGQLGDVEWKVYAHDQPADLRQRLLASGFEPEGPEAVMVLDLEETSEIITSTPDSITVRRLEQASQLKVVRQIEETVWGEDMAWINEQLGADMEKADYLSVYAAYVDGQAACAGWIYFHANGQFADLWGGSTLPEHRGRGLYTALLSVRAQEAAARGYRFLTIDTSPMSQPIVAKHGFRLLTTAWACKWGKEL